LEPHSSHPEEMLHHRSTAYALVLPPTESLVTQKCPLLGKRKWKALENRSTRKETSLKLGEIFFSNLLSGLAVEENVFPCVA